MLTDWTRREVLTTLSMTAAAGLVAHTGPAVAQSVKWSEQAKQQLPDDALLFDLLSDWVPDEKVRHRNLFENPATLYDFPKGGRRR
jgi:hypothetical protein